MHSLTLPTWLPRPPFNRLSSVSPMEETGTPTSAYLEAGSTHGALAARPALPRLPKVCVLLPPQARESLYKDQHVANLHSFSSVMTGGD